jgi:pimeloyl-ACP methyl ester carboxylesterase
MKLAVITVHLAAALVMALPPHSLRAIQTDKTAGSSETRIPAGNTSLYARAIGQGRPMIVLHGGPDFDHGYLLPDMDRLKDAFRLVYYDQRGRGRSAGSVRPEDVTIASEVEDLDRVRRHFRLDAPALLGHSWGAVLALEYAIRHPTRVSRLVLMNPAPASAGDAAVLRKAYLEKLGGENVTMRELLILLERISGRRMPKRAIPGWLALASASVAESWARLRASPTSCLSSLTREPASRSAS